MSIMIGLYSGLCWKEILVPQWDCVFLDESASYISVRQVWLKGKNRSSGQESTIYSERRNGRENIAKDFSCRETAGK